MRRRLVVCGLVLLFAGSHPTRGIILFGGSDPVRNSITPGDNSGWQFEGQFGAFVGTPIAPLYFMTANHISGNVGDVFVFHGESFTTTATYADFTDTSPQMQISDLRIWKVDHAFSTYAPVMQAASSVGQTLRVFGQGAARGNEMSVNGVPKGWAWSGDGYKLRWGSNTIAGLPDGGEYLQADFNADVGPDEAHLSNLDSGGGVFIQEAGLWKLAAINYGVDSLNNADGSSFTAALYDARGYYYYNANNVLTPIPDKAWTIPPRFYSTRVYPRLSWIQGIVGVNLATHSGRELHCLAARLLFSGGNHRGNIDRRQRRSGWRWRRQPAGICFNLDPTFPEPATLTPVTGVRGLPSITRGANGTLKVEYVRRKTASDSGITYAAQFASSLTAPNWQPSVAETVTSINARWERVVATDPSPASELRFARVQVNATP